MVTASVRCAAFSIAASRRSWLMEWCSHCELLFPLRPNKSESAVAVKGPHCAVESLRGLLVPGVGRASSLPARRSIRRHLECSRLFVTLRAQALASDCMSVLCVKFCKGGHGWLGSRGLAELNFLVLFEIVHIEVAVGLEPVLVSFDGKGSNEASTSV